MRICSPALPPIPRPSPPSSAHPLHPTQIALNEEGHELGVADDMVFGRTNSKQGSGTVGVLTGGRIDRTEYYRHACVLALIPFLECNRALF